jgi:signal transduction histidine kinase
MTAPLVAGNLPEWRKLVHHETSFDANQTVESVYGKVLSLGLDFAVIVTSDNIPTGLISFKMMAAALSAKYGHALFAKRKLRDVRVPGVVFGSITKAQPNKEMPLIIPLDHVAVIQPSFDFFEAQFVVAQRPPEHSFDDIILATEDGHFCGLISMRAFMKVQMDMLRWQQVELRRRHEETHKTLQQLSQAQDELVDSAKMAALGELVAGIAHEMNTPLGVLISSHDMIEKIFDLLTKETTPARRAQLDHYLRTNIDLGREASERVTQIIRSLRIFGRDDQQEQHTASLTDLITSTLVLLASKFKSSINVHTDIVETAHVLCYPGQISQVLVNILTNAAQAMDNQGDIYIDLQRGMTSWELTIRDTGPGIPTHLMDRIFDPGFTTKGVGVGTGLGLSISKKIVEHSHGGRIIATNHPGGGAIFRIDIPLLPLDKSQPGGAVSELPSIEAGLI